MRYSTHSYKRYRLSLPKCDPIEAAYGTINWRHGNWAKDALAFYNELVIAKIGAKLCQGTIRTKTGRREHAWVEVEGKVYDYFTLGVSKDCWVSDTNAVSTA